MDILSYVLGLQAGKASGGGSGGGSSGEYSIQEGNFDATSQEMTVSHGGNKIPDIIIVSTDNLPAANTLFLAYGFSQAMIDRLGNGYFSRVKFLEAAYHVRNHLLILV